MYGNWLKEKKLTRSKAHHFIADRVFTERSIRSQHETALVVPRENGSRHNTSGPHGRLHGRRVVKATRIGRSAQGLENWKLNNVYKSNYETK